MKTYFKKENKDTEFYNEFLSERLPDKIFDAHTHVNLPKYAGEIPAEVIAGDWALECGLDMTDDDFEFYAKQFFPDKTVNNLIMPCPVIGVDIKGNNRYISDVIKQKNKSGLMCIRPEWDDEYVYKTYTDGGFCGFKPYPYFASSVKGADVSIFDFMTHEHFKIADRLKAKVLLHLPRSGRLAADDNVNEIKEIIDKYPNVKLVIAHFGRCFNLSFFEEGLKKLGSYTKDLYFDTAAVLNPEVIQYAFEKLNDEQILYGTDLPIFLWHGKREWSDTQYFNLCREDFAWNKHKYKEKESEYTFYLYEQAKNYLDVIYQANNGIEIAQKVFCTNAIKVYGGDR